MQVVRLKRGWRVNLTDNEYEMLRAAVDRGLGVIKMYQLDERLPYKVRKVLSDVRWEGQNPLTPDEDRRAA